MKKRIVVKMIKVTSWKERESSWEKRGKRVQTEELPGGIMEGGMFPEVQHPIIRMVGNERVFMPLVKKRVEGKDIYRKKRYRQL